jgi:hypothetical protein
MLGEMAVQLRPDDADLDARAYDDALGSGTLREYALGQERCKRSGSGAANELPAAGFRLH